MIFNIICYDNTTIQDQGGHPMKFLSKKSTAIILAALMALPLAACGNQKSSTEATVATIDEAVHSTAASTADQSGTSAKKLTEADVTTTQTIENTADGEHAITADGESATYQNVKVIKSGDSSESDKADFYGDNATIFATNGGTLNLSDIVVKSDGKHANGVFSYGEGTTVNIKDSYIETAGNCSGGLMTTGGGTMNASDLTINTSGNSSAAIRSDRGGGTVNVSGGYYTTSGTGSPVIYSTADITVSDAEMTSTASQGVVVEGKNSVTLNNVNLNADNKVSLFVRYVNLEDSTEETRIVNKNK